MPNELIQKMRQCGDCRKLAVAYGLDLAASRRPGAYAPDWELQLVVKWLELAGHLIVAHATWLLDARDPQCETCEAWRSSQADHAIGPITEVEAFHRAWHLCEPLRAVSTDYADDLSYLII